MAVEKLAISFPPALAREVRARASAASESVSGWLADAAARKLRRIAAREALDAYEAEHGVITDEELERTRTQWPG